MLSERLVRQDPDRVRAALRRRGAADAARALDEWYALDAARRARLARESDPGESARLAAEQRALLARVPNLPEPRVPDGASARANVELRRWGDPPALAFAPRAHDELAARLGLLDRPRATRLAGPRFPLLVGLGALLARALAGYMLDTHVARGYVEVAPPHLVRAQRLVGTGHLPTHERALYAVPRDGLYLSPTAEVQLVALHAGEILPEKWLPLAYTAWTPAFRREAGGGHHSERGLMRQHQFDKVELVRIAQPEAADAAFTAIVTDAEAVLRALGLAYRVVAVCAGDLGFAAQRTWDLEVWMPSQDGYVEVSSVSDCGTFQARGLGLRYAPRSGGHARLPHTLNGSALAVGRTLAALLENGQRADGSVALPDALAARLGHAALSPEDAGVAWREREGR